MSTIHNMNSLPFNNVKHSELSNLLNEHGNDTSAFECNNNDFFNPVDPDINFGFNANRPCTYYTINTFNDVYGKFNSKIKHLSLFHMNIRSSSHTNLNDLLCYLDTLDIDFKVIGLSENWGKTHNIDLRHIPGYTHHYCIRPRSKIGGGASLYIKKELQQKNRNDLRLDSTVAETVFVEIDKKEYQTNRNIIIGILYKPPSTSILKFNEQLEKLLNSIQREKKYAYLLGDFNICTKHELASTNQEKQYFAELFLSHLYRKLITIPTRINVIAHTSTLIDNIYTNMPYNKGDLTGVFQTHISDHYSIFTIKTSTVNKDENKYLFRRNLNKKNISSFRKSLKKINWNTLYNYSDTQQAYSHFTKYIKECFDLQFPKQKVKINYKNRNEWIDDKLKNEIKERERLSIIKRKKPTQENIAKYKYFKNLNLSNQRKAEINFYKEQFELYKSDAKKSWKILKRILGKDKQISEKQIDFIINNQLVSDSAIIANTFNTYFINVGRTLAHQIKSNINPLSYIDINVNSIFIPPITEHEIILVIKSLNNSSPGYDELPSSVMKQCLDLYITPLTYLINLSICEGSFPDGLKLAKVLPIYKSEDEQLVQNYRPISVLPFFSKIFEKLMSNYLIDFIDNHNILYNKQFGFRKFHSTSHAIITLVEKISKALDTGKIVVGVFLDLKKAFDTVDHSILLKKLYALGVRGNIYEWFNSYLRNRTQFVSYNTINSETMSITHGVPQGSIMGPLLFILYINDFSRASDILFSIMYADDTNVFIEGSTYDGIIDVLNVELTKLDTWLKANKLTINVKKTHYMVFHRSRIKSSKDVQINQHILSLAKSTTFLGIIIDDKLKWTNHINHVKNKISKAIGIINKTRDFIDRHTTKQLYYTFVYPYLIYCTEIWGNASATHLDPIIKLQKRCIRNIAFAHFNEHTAPLFKSLDILEFKKLVIQRISLTMYKHFNCSLPSPVSDLFLKNKDIHNHYTRQRELLHTAIANKEATYKCFSFHGIQIWNYMLDNVRTDVSYTCFKKITKIHLQTHTIKYRII